MQTSLAETVVDKGPAGPFSSASTIATPGCRSAFTRGWSRRWAPRIVKFNEGLAKELGLDSAALQSAEGVQVLSGNLVPEDASPIAMAYAGHQFGGFVPQLGDGRAILLGEVETQR